MSFDAFLYKLTRRVLFLTTLATFLLYIYPIWQSCTFPSTGKGNLIALRDTLRHHVSYAIPPVSPVLDSVAPFRLLVLADPQIEGDSSLPKPEDALPQKLVTHWRSIWNVSAEDVPTTVYGVITELATVDLPAALHAIRKRLDLFGNDYYLAHIYRTLRWWTNPTHVTVLGDLLGSQWVTDGEFDRRAGRFWHRVFASGHKVEDSITALYTTGITPLLDMDDPEWQSRIINIAGNHDIGYAGDISQKRIDRFEQAFGKVNWDVRFKYPVANSINTSRDATPTLHLVVFNSMLLDTPAMDEDLQAQTYEYLNSVISDRVHPVEDKTSFTLLLTHVPLFKEKGICTDSKFFDFFNDKDGDCNGQCRPGGLKEQNHLSDYASHRGTLESLFGMSGGDGQPGDGKGRPGLILNGHDHHGCDTWHYIPVDSKMTPTGDGGSLQTNFQAVRWKDAQKTQSHSGIREVTMRSMMGEFGGSAGLLSAWFDFEQGEWRYDIRTCKLGVQHIWWAIHVLNLVGVVMTSLIVARAYCRHDTMDNGRRYERVSLAKKDN